jgi:hypothetical protein
MLEQQEEFNPKNEKEKKRGVRSSQQEREMMGRDGGKTKSCRGLRQRTVSEQQMHRLPAQ